MWRLVTEEEKVTGGKRVLNAFNHRDLSDEREGKRVNVRKIICLRGSHWSFIGTLEIVVSWRKETIYNEKSKRYWSLQNYTSHYLETHEILINLDQKTLPLMSLPFMSKRAPSARWALGCFSASGRSLRGFFLRSGSIYECFRTYPYYSDRPKNLTVFFCGGGWLEGIIGS